MAYTDDAVLAKLSALNETQESIVTVAQWVMFHRRFADRTGRLWLQRLKDSGSNKRLNLIYLANEVAQQSKVRKKEDFLIAFSPIIAEATATAYKGATSEVQGKLERVVEVWRARNIFELPIQEAIESRIEELKKVRAAGKRTGAGSIFSNNSGSSFPHELADLVAPQQTISKLVLSTKTALNSAHKDYDKLTDPSAVTPTLPVHAARLNGLLKTLANAENAVTESIKARKLLIESLEKILDTNQTALVAEEEELATLSSRKTEIDNKKKDVEDSIMRGLSNPSTPVGPTSGSTASQPSLSPAPELGRPEVEALTPPVYAQPPPRSPAPQLDLDAPNGNGAYSAPADVPEVMQAPAPATSFPGLSPSNSYGNSYGRPASAASGSSAKKRKLNNGDDFPDLGGEDAMDGLDADVAEMLRRESGSGV